MSGEGSPRLAVRFPEDMLREVRAAAARLGWEESTLIRVAVATFILEVEA